MNDHKYDYYAYIAFAEKDKKWGKWLQRNLRSYRLPQSNGDTGNKETPRRCLPILHKREILEEGGEGIRTAIERSKFLIVVCSYNALADTDNLDTVIKRFISGGADTTSIIPFIVNDDKRPEENCFPCELQRLCAIRTILGANIYDSGAYNAFLKSVAHMHGLKLEELESEESRRKRRDRKRLAAATAVLSVALIILGYYAWDYYALRIKYYADYTEKYGIPEGIHELTGKELRNSKAHYAIASSRRKVRELRHENIDGELRTYGSEAYMDRPVKATFEYSDNGELSEIVRYDENGDVIMKLDYINRKTVDVYHGDNGDDGDGTYIRSRITAKDEYALERSRDEKVKPAIIRYLIDYDEEGLMYEIRYSSSEIYNTAASDENGICGLRFRYDTCGRVTEILYLVSEDLHKSAVYREYYSPVSAEGSIGKELRSYDEMYGLTDVSWTDQNNDPVECKEGYSRIHINYDEYHNLNGESYER